LPLCEEPVQQLCKAKKPPVVKTLLKIEDDGTTGPSFLRNNWERAVTSPTSTELKSMKEEKFEKRAEPS